MTTAHAKVEAGDVPAARAGWREWVGLAVLCLPTMLAAVDLNVMFLALPHVAADLGATGVQQLWVVDVYGFMITASLVTMGALGDRVGRRKVLLAGAAAFLAASVMAAFATSTAMLIGARALLGVAGAAITPSVLALIRTMFADPRQLGAAMGAWGTSLMAGIVLGPVVGGLLLGAFWWGSIFLMAVPVMALLLLAGPLLVPESGNPDGGRLDLLSVLLSLGAILPLVYGLKEGVRAGWEAPPLVAVVAGAAFAVVFVRRQARLASPLLDLGMFRNRALSVAALLGLCSPLVSGGTTLMASLFMQVVEGLTPFRVALWMLAPSLGMVVVGNLAVAAARRVRPASVLAAGALVAAAGMLVLTRLTTGSGLTTLLAGLTIAFVGGGAVGILSATLIMTSAPPEKAGSAGSLSAMLGEFGTALGVAVLGVIGTAAYRGEVTVPAGVPAGAASAARESIAGAMSAVQQLPPGQAAAALLDSARDAFTSGLNLVAVVAAAAFAGLAVLAFVGLRHVPATGAMPMPGGPPAREPDGAAAAVD